MNDLKTSFERDLDRLPGPPPWREVESRAAAPELVERGLLLRPEGLPSRRRIGAILVAAVITAGLLAGLIAVKRNGPKPTPSPAVPPKISVVDRQSAVIVGLNGATIRSYRPFPRDAFAATLSPDGRSIAYVVTDYPGNDRIVIRQGRTTRRILPPGLSGSFPTWSSDGTRLAFQGHLRGAEDDIYIVDPDGGHLRKLTKSPEADEWPAWAPDGSGLIYVNDGTQPTNDSGFSPTSTIWTVPITGGAATPLPGGPRGVTQPDYSPDGKRIAFEHHGVWVVGANGANPHQVSAIGGSPRWSADGSKIAVIVFDPTWRPTIDIFGSLVDVPALNVGVLDVATGNISLVGKTQVATVSNAPRWRPSGDGLFVYRVERTPET